MKKQIRFNSPPFGVIRDKLDKYSLEVALKSCLKEHFNKISDIVTVYLEIRLIDFLCTWDTRFENQAWNELLDMWFEFTTRDVHLRLAYSHIFCAKNNTLNQLGLLQSLLNESPNRLIFEELMSSEAIVTPYRRSSFGTHYEHVPGAITTSGTRSTLEPLASIETDYLS